MYDQIDQLTAVSRSVGRDVVVRGVRESGVWEVTMTLNGDEETLCGTGETLDAALTHLNAACALIVSELERMG